MTRLLDLSLPQTLRELMGTGPSQSFVEFSGNSGSDVEDAEDKTVSVRDRNVPASHRPLYVADTLRGKTLSPHSRFGQWYDATVAEMWAFFGMIIAMALIPVDELEEYWSKD
ncbi:PiggyBac transposable element-derived protein 4 [Plakobranchus ocellatus]|uniref:PiggyBac transposable element-derived protein 4 n=1 Tax=Plakobranchus ocellatus TaxID=259542 RepID=A0AAV4A813_9GAST|nr:PiggyBac transposable element-derived protein 4 [Plakobranchus ocellatus]